MKTVLSCGLIAVFLAAAGGSCSALRSIGIITPADAKAMALELRTVGPDPEQVWVELEFKPDGKFKNYEHVELGIQDGEKSLLSYTVLQDRKLDNGRVIVRLLTVRSFLPKLVLTVVCGDATQSGYEVRVKDFIAQK